MGGCFYIVGDLRIRNAKGTENLEFCNLTALVAHSDVLDDHLHQELISGMSKHFTSRVLLNRSYEYEHLNFLSQTCTNIIEFIVGLACYVCGDIGNAYFLHARLYAGKRFGFRNELLYKDALMYLNAEIEIIVCMCFFQRKYEEARIQIHKHAERFPNQDISCLLEAQLLIREAVTVEQYRAAIPVALSLIRKRDFSFEIRGAALVNRAYLFLLSGQYSDAEKAYRAAEKYVDKDSNVYSSAIHYCDEVIENEEKSYEHPTAYYVKALLMEKNNCPIEEIEKAWESVANLQMSRDSYYIKMAQKALKAIFH